MECAQVTLALHEHVFHLPLHVVYGGHHFCVAVVAHSVSEVIQQYSFHFHRIPISAEAQIFWRGNVVKLAIVASGHCLKPIANIMAIEIHQKTNKSYVVGRNTLFHIAIVRVAERWVLRWLQPLVDAVHAHKGLELVRVITLIEQLGESVSCNFGIFYSKLGNLDELFWVR